MPNDYLSEMELDRAVLFILHQHKGRENAILRWDLVAAVFGADVVIEPMRTNNNPYDRQVRDSIERWRSQGQHLCNMQGGYYTADTRREYEEWKKSYLSSVYRQLQITAVMDETANHRWGAVPKEAPAEQVSLFEV